MVASAGRRWSTRSSPTGVAAPRSATWARSSGLSLDQVDAHGALLGGAVVGRGHGLGATTSSCRTWASTPKGPPWSPGPSTLAEELRGLSRGTWASTAGGFVDRRGRRSSTWCPWSPPRWPTAPSIQWDKYGVEGPGVREGRRARRWACSPPSARAFDLMRAAAYGKRDHELASDPGQEDPAVYEMFSRADTVGVFQIESRAQQSMLPAPASPQCFYDLVIEVAIVRPGPHPGRHGPPLPASAATARSPSPTPIPPSSPSSSSHPRRPALPGAGDGDGRRRSGGFTPGRGRQAAPRDGGLAQAAASLDGLGLASSWRA